MSRVRWCVASVLLLLLWQPAALAQAPAGSRFTVEEMLKLRRVSDPQPVAGRPARGLRGHRREPREEQPCQPHLARAGRRRRTRVDRPVRQGGGHAALVAGRQAAGVRLDPRRQLADLDGRHGPERPCRRAEEDHQPRHRGVRHRLVARRQVARVRVRRLPGVRDERVQRGGAEEVRGPQEQGARLRPPDVPPLGVVEGGPLQPPLPRAVGRVGGAARRDARRGGRAAVLAGRPDDYAFSPDSKELAFARKTDPVEAISTNSDLFLLDLDEPGRQAAEDHDEPGGRRRTGLLAGRPLHRVPRAAAAGLRGRPLAGDALRPQDAASTSR